MARITIVVFTLVIIGGIGICGSEAAKRRRKSNKNGLIDLYRSFEDKEPTCRCGENKYKEPSKTSRIIGGFASKPGKYPWMAALCLNGSCQTDSLLCGGSLINDRYVLTTAHCIQGLKQGDFKVVLGENRIFPGVVLGPGSVHGVKKLIPHPKYDPRVYSNNIGLVKLKRKVQVTDKINPICLPSVSQCYIGATAYLSGWGDTTGSGTYPGILNEVPFEVISREDCQAAYSMFPGAIDRAMICGWSRDANGCEGDSGGPLMFKNSCGFYEQIGIAMGGVECTDLRFPAVFIKVKKYLHFIRHFTRDAHYCPYPDDD